MHLLSFEAPQQPKNAIRKIMAPTKCYLSVASDFIGISYLR